MWPQTSRIRKLLIARQLVCLKTTCNSYSRLIIALTDKNYKYSHLQVLPNAPPLPIRISSGSGLFSVTQRSRTNICSDHEQFRYCKTLKNEFAHQIQRSPACKCIILCCSQNLGTPCICQQFYKLKIGICPSNPKVYVPGGLFDDSFCVAAARSWALHATNFYKKNGITAEYAQGSRKMMVMDAKGWCALFQNPKRWRAGWRTYIWSTSTSYGKLTTLIFLSMESWPSAGRESWGHDQAVPQSLWSS